MNPNDIIEHTLNEVGNAIGHHFLNLNVREQVRRNVLQRLDQKQSEQMMQPIYKNKDNNTKAILSDKKR